MEALHKLLHPILSKRFPRPSQLSLAVLVWAKLLLPCGYQLKLQNSKQSEVTLTPFCRRRVAHEFHSLDQRSNEEQCSSRVEMPVSCLRLWKLLLPVLACLVATLGFALIATATTCMDKDTPSASPSELPR